MADLPNPCAFVEIADVQVRNAIIAFHQTVTWRDIPNLIAYAAQLDRFGFALSAACLRMRADGLSPAAYFRLDTRPMFQQPVLVVAPSQPVYQVPIPIQGFSRG